MPLLFPPAVNPGFGLPFSGFAAVSETSSLPLGVSEGVSIGIRDSDIAGIRDPIREPRLPVKELYGELRGYRPVTMVG